MTIFTPSFSRHLTMISAPLIKLITPLCDVIQYLTLIIASLALPRQPKKALIFH